MTGRLQYPSLTPLEYFATLVADDASLSLTEAAVAIAQDEYLQLDSQSVLSQIDTLGDRLKRRLPGDAGPRQRLRMLNLYFFQELGFSGNVNNYYAPDNSYVHSVLDTRRGIPISLAVIYIELAHHCGLVARGVSFPGHFLVKVKLSGGEAIIDPFTGNSLSRDQLDEMLGPYRRSRGLIGEFDVPLGLFLQAATAREVLARMLRNLKEIFRSSGDHVRMLAVQERLVVLVPEVWEERRDRGFAHAELKHMDDAERDLADYLANVPGASDRDAVSQKLAALRERGQ